MCYSIRVLNRHAIGAIDGRDLINAITRSNFHTLCQQYGLDTRLVAPAKAHLEVISVQWQVSPFFVIKYHPEGHRPVVVYQWGIDQETGCDRYLDSIEHCESEILNAYLRRARYCVAITLSRSQLNDMGLLIAYEVARWAAEQGEGIIQGVQGRWYRLNQHKAFIPLNDQ